MKRILVDHLSGDPPSNTRSMTLIDFLIKKSVDRSIKDGHKKMVARGSKTKGKSI